MPVPFSNDDDDDDDDEDDLDDDDEPLTGDDRNTTPPLSQPSPSPTLPPPTTSSPSSPSPLPPSSTLPSPSFIASTKKRRVVIVAKQLPVRTVLVDGRWRCEWEDTRNFLSALQVLHRLDQIDVKWVGCPNANVTIEPSQYEEYEDLLYDYDCIPVFLPGALAERFYRGFCKGVMWPLLHYVMPKGNESFGAVWDDNWQAYTAANTLYASVVTHAVETPTDIIWIQNYHLLLLPSFLRTKLPRAKIGLFIHTPFPSSDVFRVLPTRQNILSSMLATDLIGFHTFDYARHFLSCIKRVMDLDFETLPGGALGVRYNGRFVSITISHVGIDSTRFAQLTEEVQPEVAAIQRSADGRQIVLGIDDYDPVKGVMMKVFAYKHFLSSHPEWATRVKIIQILHTSSTDDPAIRRRVLAELAELGDAVTVVEKELSMAEITAYYSASSVCIVSTFWDGLNLTPYEYSASQPHEHPGVLIISEFMGCARSLNGVLRVNPWSLTQMADALVTALSMSEDERRANHSRRYQYVMNHSIERWGLSFLEQLDKATKQQSQLNYVQVGWGSNVKLMGLRSDFAHLEDDAVTTAYRKAGKRVILLDYDGTLTPLEKSSEASRLIHPSATIKRILRALCDDEDNDVFIMTGRTRSVLTDWFDDIPQLGLAAEKGLFLRWPRRRMQTARYDGWVEENSRLERAQVEQRRRMAEAAAIAEGRGGEAHVIQEDSLSMVVTNDWECFTECDTRVLTDAGLLFLDEVEARLKAGQSLRYGCYDVSSQQLRYCTGRLVFPSRKPTHLLNFTSPDEMGRWGDKSGSYGNEGCSSQDACDREGEENRRSRHLSLRVTPSHRMLVQLGRETLTGEVKWDSGRGEPPSVVPADSLLSSCSCPVAELCEHRSASVRMLSCAEAGHAADSSAELAQRQQRLGMQDEQFAAFLELLGFWLGISSVPCDQRGKLQAVTFSHVQASDCAWLRSMAIHAGVEPHHCSDGASKEHSSFHITDPSWCAFLADEFGRPEQDSNGGEVEQSPTQRLPSWLLMHLSSTNLRLVIRGLWRASSSDDEQPRVIYTSDALFRDQLMQALLHCGFSPFTSLSHPAGTLRHYRRRDQPSSSHYTPQFVHNLSPDEQLLYFPIAATADTWAVTWTEPTDSTSATDDSCWLSMRRQESITAEPYDAQRDGRVWCCAVDHPDHLIFAQRAERVDGVVTKQSRPIITGQCLIPLDDITWKETALSLILSYTEQTDGSWIEPKEYAIVWHYENADPEYGRMQAAELQKYLVKILANPSVDVVKYDYARLLEVKPHGISKGLAANAILESLLMKQSVNMQKSSSSVSLHSLNRETSGGSLSPVAATLTASSSLVTPRLASRPASPGVSPGLSSFDFNQPAPFLLCVGDDRSDEDMFVAINNKEYLKGMVRDGGEGVGELGISRSWSSSQREREEKERGDAVLDGPGLTLLNARRDDEEEKWDADALRSKQHPPSPFTFTVCVGMKPSNAHYFLHDDDEVLKMLLSLATCSQRMAQTRLIDNQQLGELARTYSVNTMANLLLARTQTMPGAGVGVGSGGSANNLVALMQANSLSVASGQRAALAAVAKGYAVAGLVGGRASEPGGRGGGLGSSTARRKVSEEEGEEEESGGEELEYGSGSDDDDDAGT